jgi:hypothetical protein
MLVQKLEKKIGFFLEKLKDTTISFWNFLTFKIIHTYIYSLSLWFTDDRFRICSPSWSLFERLLEFHGHYCGQLCSYLFLSYLGVSFWFQLQVDKFQKVPFCSHFFYQEIWQIIYRQQYCHVELLFNLFDKIVNKRYVPSENY